MTIRVGTRVRIVQDVIGEGQHVGCTGTVEVIEGDDPAWGFPFLPYEVRMDGTGDVLCWDREDLTYTT